MSGNELTRRSFVKMGMAGLAGGALTAMGGCAAQPQTQSQSQSQAAEGADGRSDLPTDQVGTDVASAESIARPVADDIDIEAPSRRSATT